MAKRVGLISINLVAGTAQFNADMGKAKAQIVAVGGAAQDAGRHVVSGMQASSAAMLDATIKQQLQHGLGALGKKLGIGKKDVELTRKGQTPDTAIYVTDTGGAAAPPSTTPGTGAGSPNLKQLGGLFGSAGGLSPPSSSSRTGRHRISKRRCRCRR